MGCAKVLQKLFSCDNRATKKGPGTLAGWLSGLELQPVNQSLWVRFPVRAHAWIMGLIPGLWSGCAWEATSRWFSLPLSLSLLLSLKAMKKCPRVRNF